MLTITPKAADELRRTLAERGFEPSLSLRIALPADDGDESEDFRFVFTFGDPDRPGDAILEVEGLRVQLDAATVARLDGSELDYLDSSLNRGFVFRGAAAGPGGCGSGCGEEIPV